MPRTNSRGNHGGPKVEVHHISGGTAADNYVPASQGNGTAAFEAQAGGGGTPGGSNTQLQYNNAGAFGGITGATTNGTALTLTSPTFITPALGTPASGVLTNCTGLPTAGHVDGSVTLAKMADLAQDLFIVRTTASTGVPQTATCTAAARTVLDDATVAAMVDTLGGASSTGTGGLVRATSPTLVTPALGTPASGTLTNCTGLPLAGLTSYGPILPDSAVPDDSGEVYPDVVSNGSRYQAGCGVGTATELTADRTWWLDFAMPYIAPGGTLKLVMGAYANATANDGVMQVTWASYADEEIPSTITLQDEGNTTITWAAGDAYARKQAKLTLNADTWVAGERIVMAVVAKNASWTLTAKSVWTFHLIWE